MSDNVPDNGSIDVTNVDPMAEGDVTVEEISAQALINAELEIAKMEGKTRLARIQGIMQDAFSQTVVELKEGWNEIQAIAKDTVSAKVNRSSQNVAATGEEIPQEGTSTNAKALAIAVVQSLKNRLFVSLQNDYEKSRQQYVELRNRFTNLDAKLSERYGDRYANVKQKAGNITTWYNNATANSEAMDVTLLQEKQAEVDRKIGDMGVSAAKKEQQIKQQLKRFLETAAAKL